MTTPGDDDDFLRGVDPVSAFHADVEAEAAIEFERQLLGDLENWKSTGLMQAMTERCTCTDAGGMVEVRGGRCTFCRKPYVD
jgi:hypothetical protein